MPIQNQPLNAQNDREPDGYAQAECREARGLSGDFSQLILALHPRSVIVCFSDLGV
jgi:hypothetical protein